MSTQQKPGRGDMRAASEMARSRRGLRAASAACAAMMTGIAALSLGATAAGASAKEATGSGSLVKVTIGYAAPVVDHMLPSITQAAGLFAKNGITANVVALPQSQLEAALLAGQAQFGTFAAPGPEIATIDGSPLPYIAQWEDAFDVVLDAGPNYPTVKSLNGATSAISSAGSFSDLLTHIADKKYHITMHELPLGSFPAQISAFESGTAAAMPAASPYQLPSLQAKLPGVHQLIDWRKFKGLTGVGLVGYKPWLTKHSATVVKVLRALSEGLTYMKAHATKSIAVIAKVTGSTPTIASVAYHDMLPTLTKTIVPPLQDQKNLAKYLAPTYPTIKGFPLKTLADTTYAEKALKKGK